MNTGDIIIAALLFFGGGKALAASSKGGSMGPTADGIRLLERANQKRAADWIPLFANMGVPETLARSLARWAGIESSGNAMATSGLGERGLLQISAANAKDAVAAGAITAAEYAAMAKATTPTQEHARIAIKLERWWESRASRYVTNWPDDPLDRVWYAKLYHQRPVDVRDGKMHGPAAQMARVLAERWKNDARKMHYLRAANTVAWNNPNGFEAGGPTS